MIISAVYPANFWHMYNILLDVVFVSDHQLMKIHSIDLLVFIRVGSLALEQSQNHWVTLDTMGKIDHIALP